MIETNPRVKNHGRATVHSCFGLVSSHQYSTAIVPYGTDSLLRLCSQRKSTVTSRCVLSARGIPTRSGLKFEVSVHVTKIIVSCLSRTKKRAFSQTIHREPESFQF